MRYLGIFILGCVAGLVISCTKVTSPEKPKDTGVVLPHSTKKLPREVQEQFDAYLMTSPILETVVVRIVKKVLEALLLTSIIALVTDYPVYSILAIVLPIVLVSYPVARFAITRAVRPRDSGPIPKVLPN